MANAIGAGNVISTRDDMIKWGRYLFRHAPPLIRSTMLKEYWIDPEDKDIVHLGLTTEKTNHL